MRTIDTHYRSNKFNFHFHHYLDEKTNNIETVKLNTHSVYEILYLVEGNATYTVGSKQLKLTSGDLVVLNKRTPHIVEADLRQHNYERFTLMFDLNMFSNANDQSFANYILGTEDDTIVFKKHATQTSNILPLLQKIEKLILAPTDSLDIELFSNTLLVAEQINRLVKHNAPAQMSTNHHVENILAYINQNVFSKISLVTLSKDLFLSPYYVSHIFSKHMKMSVKNYINLTKMHVAEELINSGEQPTVVARKLGFDYYSTFFNLYYKMLGKTPSKK